MQAASRRLGEFLVERKVLSRDVLEHMLERETNEGVPLSKLLINEGIKVVGIDYLSVEKYGSETFETHLTLLQAGTLIIEGLDLREVEPGDYEIMLGTSSAQGKTTTLRVAEKAL